MRAKFSIGFVALCAGFASPLAAQLPGSIAEERRRLATILGDSIADTSATAPGDRAVGGLIGAALRAGVQAARPYVRVSWNSAIPFSLNDGAMWAGRGVSFEASAGIRASRHWNRWGGMSLAAAIVPSVVYSQNRPFFVWPGIAGRSPYSSPFHPEPVSADVPLRFGDQPLLSFTPGQSFLTLRVRSVAAGVTTENESWGPGIRNQLVMSANAAGVPRLFIGTATPRRTRVGTIDAKLIAGTLSESRFFDATSANDYRSLSGVRVQIVPAFDSSLTLGIARVVYAPIDGSPLLGTLASTLDALLTWQSLSVPSQTTDQISALFARWIAPESGLEVYGEWARLELPRTPMELIRSAHHTLGYTLGAQWANQRRRGVLRVQGEVTNLEQSSVFASRPPSPDFYTGRVAQQGYTQRGQVIGAAIGPGASSQWIALDFLPASWQAGVYVGRIRWENDALYREGVPTLFKHDVTVLWGVRGAHRTRWTDLSVDATYGYRHNYLFQNGFANIDGRGTVDVRNFTVTVAATPR